MTELERFLKYEAIKMDLTSPVSKKGYWERDKLTSVTIGDENVDFIYHAVGMALSQWEMIENEIFNLYMIFCGSDSANTTNALRRSFGTIESSDGRRKVLEEAARVYFGDDKYPEGIAKPYKLLFTAHKNATSRRNEIAHGIAHGFIINNENKGNFLFPAPYNSGRNSTYIDRPLGESGGPFMTECYRYTSKEINTIASKFIELACFARNCLAASGKIDEILKIQLMQLAKETQGKKS